MFSTDALTWHLAFRHHLRLESCESETGFSHVAWVKVGFNITGGQLRSFKKAVPSKGICWKTVRRHSAVCNASPNHPLDTTARLAILILLPRWLE